MHQVRFGFLYVMCCHIEATLMCLNRYSKISGVLELNQIENNSSLREKVPVM